MSDAAPTMTFRAGETIDGKYRIVGLLGEGGMGAVYEGENERIHRRVAIKVLHAAVAAKADVVQRFEREAQAAGRIGSEHIVEVLDLGSTTDGGRYMVMEFLEGESLGERIRRRTRLTPHEIAPILHQMLSGLGAAHAAGIVHRDLKPDNVFLLHQRAGQRDFVKILDFGVSKFAALESDLSMTKTGAVVGTPFYMSPEQARGQEVDARSDLFSLGVVAYQAVTGRVPFSAATFNELVFKIALESPEPAEQVVPGLDPAFAAIIAHAMTRDPAGRYQSGAEMQAAIDAWAANAGVAIDRTDTSLPAIVPNAMTISGAGAVSSRMRTPSAMELGLAKTVAPGDAGLPEALPLPARPTRSLGVTAAAVVALIAGGLGAYLLLGGNPARFASAPVPTIVISMGSPSLPTATPSAAPIETAAPAVTAAPSANSVTDRTDRTDRADPAPASTSVTSAAPAVPTAAPGPVGYTPKPKTSAAPKASAKPGVPVGRQIGSEL